MIVVLIDLIYYKPENRIDSAFAYEDKSAKFKGAESMSDQNEIPQVTMANTKKEMMEAYQAAKQHLNSKEKQLLDAEKARKQMEKQMAEATAEAQAAQDPLQRLHELRSAIGREMASIAERFEAEIDTYRKVQAAVRTKQEELKTIYEVETAASDLASLIEAQQSAKEKFRLEMETKRHDFEEEMKEKRAAWEKEKAERDQQVKEQADALKKQRQREKEEHDYEFAREKEQRKNALEDELSSLEKEIQQKRKDFEQELSQRRMELESREEAVAKREAEMAELRKEVETFPQRMDDKVKAAVNEVSERLTSDYKKGEALLTSKFEGEKNVLSSKIEALEKLVKALETQNAELARRNEQAYEKVQDIANRAVAAAKREYIPIPTPFHDKQGQSEK